MKKTVRVFSVIIVVCVFCALLASCGNTISGKYTSDYSGTGIILTFGGSDVEIAITVSGVEVDNVDASYVIEDNKISFEFDDEDVANTELAKTFLKTISKPVSFSEGDGFIMINGTKFVKTAD